MTTKANIFPADPAAAFKPAVVLGQGLPNEINGQPVAYFWKEMLPPGRFRDAKGAAFDVDARRIDTLISTFNRAKAKGYRPFLPAGSHRERQKNYGFLIDVRKNARGVLEGLHQFIGEDAIREASRNRSSICTIRDVTDETGEHYEELIDHNAILPDPQISGLGDFVPFNPALAASRGQTVSAEVLELAASTQEPVMDLTALRKAVGAADTVSDSDVISTAVTKLGTIPTIESERDTARTELSRRPAAGEEFPAAIAKGSVNILHKQVELMAREGKISAAQATAARDLIGTPDKPNTLALSRTGADHPAEKWLEVLALGGATVNPTGQSATGAQVTELSRRTHDHSAVTGGKAGEPTEEQLREEGVRRGKRMNGEAA